MESAETTSIGSESNHAGGGQTLPDSFPAKARHPLPCEPTQVFSPPTFFQTGLPFPSTVNPAASGCVQKALVPPGRPKKVSRPAQAGTISARTASFSSTSGTAAEECASAAARTVAAPRKERIGFGDTCGMRGLSSAARYALRR